MNNQLANAKITEREEDPNVARVVAFYKTLNRSLDMRADSRLFHMRQFNNWCKAVQIQESNPRSGDGGPLRVLDLACGKGGDLRKWTLHKRGIDKYMGVDVVLPSLVDAAERARATRRVLNDCSFVCADLGRDVLGQDQELKAWSLGKEAFHGKSTPYFRKIRGGGLRRGEKFDIISIQFAIHYLMGTRERARRLFKTISELLDVGGSFIATTIDARVIIDHLMNLGLDFRSICKETEAPPADTTDDLSAELNVGGGACRLTFPKETLQRIFCEDDLGESSLFGLEYIFQLIEGSDQAAGAGDAVNAPEFLLPFPVLTTLAREVGLELDYFENFHEFFEHRYADGSGSAASLIRKMKVPNKNGSISIEEWDLCRLYCAFKFTRSNQRNAEPGTKSKLMPKALVRAKRSAGALWDTYPPEKKQRLISMELSAIDKLGKSTPTTSLKNDHSTLKEKNAM